jgi:hypothetical protein
MGCQCWAERSVALLLRMQLHLARDSRDELKRLRPGVGDEYGSPRRQGEPLTHKVTPQPLLFAAIQAYSKPSATKFTGC